MVKQFYPDMGVFDSYKLDDLPLTIEALKGSVSRDFQPPVFFMILTHMGP